MKDGKRERARYCTHTRLREGSEKKRETSGWEQRRRVERWSVSPGGCSHESGAAGQQFAALKVVLRALEGIDVPRDRCVQSFFSRERVITGILNHRPRAYGSARNFPSSCFEKLRDALTVRDAAAAPRRVSCFSFYLPRIDAAQVSSLTSWTVKTQRFGIPKHFPPKHYVFVRIAAAVVS